MTPYAVVLWFYVVMVSVVFGASIYEALVVHPAWSRQPPESFHSFMGTPVGRMDLPRFWMPVAPLYGLSALATLVLAISAGSPGQAIIVSTVTTLVTVAWTLLYFRPNIERFLGGGENAPSERLAVEVRRWIGFNWIRVCLGAIGWAGAIMTLASQRG